MSSITQKTVFSLDCGATNWRLYRTEYQLSGASARIVGEPQPAPLTSFVDRRLPAAITLDGSGIALESFGEIAQQQLDDEHQRDRVREHFKPCIGAYLEPDPQPHQKRYTHAQALEYTRLLLRALLEQVRHEKWRSGVFDDRVSFTFAYPVHWRSEFSAQVFNDFVRSVRECFPRDFEGTRFVAEPEGAILCLQHRGLLAETHGGDVTLIIDVGGSTTDIVAGRMVPGIGRLDFLGRYGEPIGGDLYDAELAKGIADELHIPASALADDPTALASLRLSGQRLKESLSRQLLNSAQAGHDPQRMVTLVMHDGSIYRKVVSLDAARFQEAVGPLDARFKALVDHALVAMAVREAEIGQVVLVGGGAQLFTIIGYLRQRFGRERVILADNPEEIVVQGLGLEFGASLDKIEPTIQFPAGAPRPEPAQAPTPFPQTSSWKLEGAERTLDLPDGTKTIGRGRENDYQIDDLKASRVHARLQVTAGRLEVVDLGSTNGTFLNGERLVPNTPHPVAPGDELIFGKTRFVCKR